MSIEERLNLIGSQEETEEALEAKELSFTFKNSTNYVLKYMVNIKASAQSDDYNAQSHNFYWQFNYEMSSRPDEASPYVIYENEIIGYAGSNNSQYDQRTFDTITDTRFITLNPGAEAKCVLQMEWQNDDDGGNGEENPYPKILQGKTTIIGAYENE